MGYNDYELVDIITGEPIYIVRQREEAAEHFYDGHSYWQAEYWHALYDLAGNMLIGWEPMRYSAAFGEFVIRQDSGQMIYTINVDGDYFQYLRGDENGIFHPEKGVVFSVRDAELNYFDGELVILRTGDYRGPNPLNLTLQTVEGKVLTSGFSWLERDMHSEVNGPAERFIGILDNRIVLIGRDGKRIASSPREIPNVRNVSRIADGLYSYQVEHGDFRATSGLLGPNLEVLIPEGAYSNFEIPHQIWEHLESLSLDDIILRGHKEIGDSNAPGRMVRLVYT